MWPKHALTCFKWAVTHFTAYSVMGALFVSGSDHSTITICASMHRAVGVDGAPGTSIRTRDRTNTCSVSKTKEI